MNCQVFSPRRLVPFGVLALVAGGAGAQAAGGGSPAPRPAAPRAISAAVPVMPAPFRCRAGAKQPAGKPPSDALKDAFGVLRRERTDDDALPARALAALKRRGFAVVDPSAARLLRADRRARAWVVPVPDVAATPTVVCRDVAARARARTRSRPGPGAAVAPREGLAVVAVGGALAGGGGALRDLQRGLAPPSVEPCAGAERNMLGVSGIVPDGVEAVFVTAADGTATRADVHANGYAFVLPRARRNDARYLVWAGANGTPHVQPLPAVAMFAGIRPCPGQGMRLPQVTPDPWAAACGPVPASIVYSPRPMPAIRVPPSRMRRLRPRRSVVVPARPLPAVLPEPVPMVLCAPRLFAPGGGPALAVPRAPQELPAPSAAPAPRAGPAPTAPAAPKPAPPRAP